MKTIEIDGHEIACDQIAEVSPIELTPIPEYGYEFTLTTKLGHTFFFRELGDGEDDYDALNEIRNKYVKAMKES